MGNTRRHSLKTISGAAALPAIDSVLTTEPRTGLDPAGATCVHSSRYSGIQ